MTISQREKAKKDLIGVISGELSSLLRSRARPGGHELSRQDVSSLSLSLAEQFLASEKFLEMMGAFAPKKPSEWLTTEDAARMSGFSRPFIAALLDSPNFEGQVSRTEKGHRRVAASGFKRWMARSAKPDDLPSALSVARSGPRDDEPVRLKESARENERRTSAKARTLAVARGMGLG